MVTPDQTLRELERQARQTNDEVDLIRWARAYLRLKETTQTYPKVNKWVLARDGNPNRLTRLRVYEANNKDKSITIIHSVIGKTLTEALLNLEDQIILKGTLECLRWLRTQELPTDTMGGSVLRYDEFRVVWRFDTSNNFNSQFNV